MKKSNYILIRQKKRIVLEFKAIFLSSLTEPDKKLLVPTAGGLLCFRTLFLNIRHNYKKYL